MKKSAFAKLVGTLVVLFLFVLMPRQVSSAAAPPVRNFRLICRGNKAAFLGWDDVKGADRYHVYQYDEETGKYRRIAKTKTSFYKVSSLKPGKTYRFIVRSVRNGKKSAKSKVVKVKAKKINVGDVHGRYWSAKLKKTIRIKLSNGKKLKIKKGTSLFSKAATNVTVTAVLKNGQKFRVSGSLLKYYDLWVTKSYKYYSKEQAEAFVNGNGYSSDTDWLIWISQYTASVHIFKGSQGKWKRQWIAECVIGKLGHTTPGEFRLRDRGTSHGKPEIHFSWNPEKNWGHAFHCLIDRNTHGAYSNGCVRLKDRDLYYLANHCPLGTKVISK